MNTRRLYRCREDKKVAGVAAGMAEYLEMDPTVIRVLWILSAFIGGFTILLYVILAFVMPLEPIETGPAARVAFSAGDGGESDMAGAPDTADGTEAATGAAPSPAAHAPIAAHGHAHGAGAAEGRHPEARPGRGGVMLGVALIVLGSVALASQVFPGWAAAALGPALLLALGAALIVGATRREAAQK